MRFDFGFIVRHIGDFILPVQVALAIFLLSFILAFCGGIVLALGRLRPGWTFYTSTTYVEIYRNTPLLVQIYFAFFGLPVFGIYLSAFLTGVLALGMQHAAFFCEIVRGAIQSISMAQREASLALGMKPYQLMRFTILPIALRKALPSIGSQAILLLQDTALVSTIGVYEITQQGRSIAERSAASFEMFVLVGAIYLLLSNVLSFALKLTERRFLFSVGM